MNPNILLTLDEYIEKYFTKTSKSSGSETHGKNATDTFNSHGHPEHISESDEELLLQSSDDTELVSLEEMPFQTDNVSPFKNKIVYNSSSSQSYDLREQLVKLSKKNQFQITPTSRRRRKRKNSKKKRKRWNHITITPKASRIKCIKNCPLNKQVSNNNKNQYFPETRCVHRKQMTYSDSNIKCIEPFNSKIKKDKNNVNLNTLPINTNKANIKSLLGCDEYVSNEMIPLIASKFLDILKKDTVHKPVYDMKIQKHIHTLQKKDLLYKCPGGEVVSSDGGGIDCNIKPHTCGITMNYRFA